MKRLLWIPALILCCFSVLVTPATAEKLSCNELTDVANDLDYIAEAFDNAGVIREGDAVDQALGEIVDVLVLIADIEKDASMDRAVDNLIQAYNTFNSDKFAGSLERVIVNLDRLYVRDCE